MTPNFILSTSTQQVDACVMEDLGDFTLEGLRRACAAQTDIFIELIDDGVIDGVVMVQGQKPELWRCGALPACTCSAEVVLRLRRDLGVNFAGAALALQLMEQLEALRRHVVDGQARQSVSCQPG